jgi:hypothetical protein
MCRRVGTICGTDGCSRLPLSLHPGSTSLGSDPDVHTFTWTLGWGAHALSTTPWDVFNAIIFHPYERTLAFSENLLGSAIIAAPIIGVTGNYVLAMNSVALLSVVLCGVGAFVLGRRLGLSPAGAVMAGLVFAFSPARFFRFPQIHLTAVQWMPFALAFLHSYLTTGQRRDLLLAIALFTLQVYASLHGGVFLALAFGLLVLHRAFTAPRLLTRTVRDAGIAGVGFDRLVASRTGRARALAAFGIGALLVTESAAIPLPVTPYRVEFPAADRWLARQPKPFAVAEVPVGPTARYHSTYMLHSMAHWQRTVHAHSSVEPPLHQEVYARLRSFPDPASLDLLARLNVTYIVVHQAMYTPDEWPAVDIALSRFGDRLSAVYADATSRVYRIAY